MKPYEANENLRAKNPFLETLATELIEDPKVYKQYFSQRVLIGEALEVFRPMNVVVRGPQGSGKSMLLNLIKHEVLTQWFQDDGNVPEGLNAVNPFVGIGVNLQRINFHLFGRRSFRPDLGLSERLFFDVACAADFINHYVFLEFTRFIETIYSDLGSGFRSWLGIEGDENSYVDDCKKWECWGGYYLEVNNIKELISSIKARLRGYTDYLNGNTDKVDSDILSTKDDIGIPGNKIGRYLNEISKRKNNDDLKRIGFFIVIDQYEVLKELNPSHGDELIRLLNTALKRRDPYAFYKIGVRTHDWDSDKGIIGAEAKLELNRDLVDVSIDRIFKRRENVGGIFTEFIEDVARRRIEASLKRKIESDEFRRMFGDWSSAKEIEMYTKRPKVEEIVWDLPQELRSSVKAEVMKRGPLECHLAVAWCKQQIKRDVPVAELKRLLSSEPWRAENWRKERVDLALFHLASRYRQKRVYFGSKSIIDLAGNNVTAFLLIAGKIWDMAAKRGVNPFDEGGIDPKVQNRAIQIAAEEWSDHDRRVQSGGEYRHGMLAKLSEFVLMRLKGDPIMSNPGYTGVSFAAVDLRNNEDFAVAYKALSKAVSWAMVEERNHKSKDRGKEQIRVKYYFHPLICAYFGIPIVRVKEPIYIRNFEDVGWVFDPSLSAPKGALPREDNHQQDFDF